jgi:hypothetical protein
LTILRSSRSSSASTSFITRRCSRAAIASTDRSPSKGPWAPTVARVRCLRGVDRLTAVGLVADITAFTAFERRTRLASDLGIVVSEKASGTVRRQGSIMQAAARMRVGCWSKRPGTTRAC